MNTLLNDTRLNSVRNSIDGTIQSLSTLCTQFVSEIDEISDHIENILSLPQDNKNEDSIITCVDDLHTPSPLRLPYQFFPEDEEYEVNGFVILD